MSVSSVMGLNRSYYIKLSICIAIPILLLFLPTTEVFTVLMRKYLAVTVFGILMFVFEVAPGPIVALALASSYAVFGVAPLDVVLSSWSHPIVFQGLLCMLILEGVNSTPLMKRIACNLIIRMGGSYRGVLFGIAVASLVAFILIPSTGTTLLIVGIGFGLCQSLNLKPGDPAAAGIMMMAGLGVCEAHNFLYGPQGIGAAAALISTTVPNFSIGYFEVTKDNIVFAPILFILPVMYSKIYKAENISGIEYFQQELKSIGKIQSSERNAIIVLAAMTVYLFTSQWHKMDMTYGFAVAAVLLFFPACKIAGMKDFKRVDMGFPMLVASCMAIGNVATAVGAGAAISNFIIPFLQTANSSFLFVITTWTSGVLANLLMTPMALYTLIAPVMGPIAEAFGYSPKIVAYLLYHTGNQVFFPYENNTILMMYGFGMMNMRQFCKGAIAKMILDLFFVCTIGFGYWKLIGLL